MYYWGCFEMSKLLFYLYFNWHISCIDVPQVMDVVSEENWKNGTCFTGALAAPKSTGNPHS